MLLVKDIKGHVEGHLHRSTCAAACPGSRTLGGLNELGGEVGIDGCRAILRPAYAAKDHAGHAKSTCNCNVIE